jgi:protein-tyrosine phosphatase
MPAPVVPIFDEPDYEASIRRAAEAIAAGKLVVLPTETVYGAAGDVSHPDGRRRLAELRGDTPGERKPFTIHLADVEDADRYLGEVNDFARRLMRKLWPGPVGMVFEVQAERRKEVANELGVAEDVIYDGSHIVLRCPDDLVTREVLSGLGPVAMTVASPGGATPWSPQGLDVELDGKVELIIDAGHTRYSKPSTLLHVHPDRYEIVRQGIYDERIIEKLLRTTILYVCSGNTCRSPMAEALTRRLLAEKLGVTEADLERSGMAVISAGSYAMPGARATPQAVEAVKNWGADLSQHRSKPLTLDLIHQADVIFTMGRSHAGAVIAMAPSAAPKVLTLDPAGDIDDPIGSDVGVYQELAGQLHGLIQKRLAEMP